MHDAGKIFIGLAIFLAIVTSPFWYHQVTGARAELPEVVHPADYEQCVAATEYMRVFHMELLNQWRDDVVRGGDREHVTPEGKVFEKSLSRTCLTCHENKEEFCDRCHAFAAVTPYCWSCHVESRGGNDGNG